MAIVFPTPYSLGYSYLRFLLIRSYDKITRKTGRLEDTTDKAGSGFLAIRKDAALGNRSYGMRII